MKKVLIISHAMEIGGAERALIGLLESFDYSKYQVDLFLCRHEGELFGSIPKEVNVLPTNQAKNLAIPIKEVVKNKNFKIAYGRLIGKIKAKQVVKKLGLKADNQVAITYSHLYTYKYFDFINQDTVYDLAISFLTPHYICLNKCHAKKKIAWIHTDYSTIDLDVVTEYDMWSKFNYIASISDQCTQSFINKFPTLENKIIRIDNIITNSMIRKPADEFIPHEMDKKNDEWILCSAGRFSNAKNFDSVPTICKYIIESGVNVKWYLIGYGGDEELIKKRIIEENMQDHVIILGKKENPYPYIKACDLYVQPSRYEGKCVAVREAQILCKPVVITNYATANSQLDDGIDGVIVPIDNKECAKGIVELLNDKVKMNQLSDNCHNRDYSNSSEIEKIYEIMELKA